MKRHTGAYPSRWKPDAAWPKQPDLDLRWQVQAACGQVDDATSQRLVEATFQADVADLAPALCRACPVRHTCFDAGQKMKASGTWGGVVLADGQPAREQRRRAAS